MSWLLHIVRIAKMHGCDDDVGTVHDDDDESLCKNSERTQYTEYESSQDMKFSSYKPGCLGGIHK